MKLIQENTIKYKLLKQNLNANKLAYHQTNEKKEENLKEEKCCNV